MEAKGIKGKIGYTLDVDIDIDIEVCASWTEVEFDWPMSPSILP